MNEEAAEQVLVKQRTKMQALLGSQPDLWDLNQNRVWVEQLVRRSQKVLSSLEFDFISELQSMRRKQMQLDEILQQN